MTNIIDERKKKSTIDKNSLKFLNKTKQLIFIQYANLKINQIKGESDTITLSTNKNSADSFRFKSEKEEPISARLTSLDVQKDCSDSYRDKQKKRKDYFGRLIKKGGKHKISFADDLYIVKSLIPEINNNNSKEINNIRKSSHLLSRNYCLPTIQLTKRSNSFSNNKSCLMKLIYNISKIKTKTSKKFKESFLDVIKIENVKKETKLNTYLFNKNRIGLSEEENATCSCYCSIW